MDSKKVREPVRLRSKRMKDGGESLYLDIYHEGRRRYEFLKLYLAPEDSRRARDKNRETLALAEAIRAKRIVELRNNAYGFENRPVRALKLLDYYTTQMNKHRGSTRNLWRCCLNHLQCYQQKDILIGHITKEWVTGFARFLGSRDISKNTCFAYLAKLRACLNAAYREGLIGKNPLVGAENVVYRQVERSFLTVEELKRLAATPIEKYPEVCRAFLFSCFTGLRWSDVFKLTWDDVREQEGYVRIVFQQQKTGGLEYLDLSSQAVAIMGERGTGRVFDLPSVDTTCRVLVDWSKRAGVAKHITFHCARHTFAVMMLDLDVDLYTVSKLLGHKRITTTQIYAKVLDKNKRAAVEKIPKII